MIEQMKRMIPELYWYNAPADISIQKLLQNIIETEHMEIKFNETNPIGTTSNSFPYVGYILTQALSKLLDKRIQFRQVAVSSPHTDEQLNRFNIPEDMYTVQTVYISRTAFNRSEINNWRNNLAPINKTLDSMLADLPGFILGTTVTNNRVIFFLDKTQYNGVMVEYILITLTYRFLIHNNNTPYPEVHTLFRDLSLALNKYTEHRDNSRYLNDIHSVYVLYLDNCPEYKVDHIKRLSNLLNKTKERRLRRYRDDVENKRETLQQLHQRIENASREFREANILYTSLLNSNENIVPIDNIQDMMDLIKRSKAIVNYAVSEESIKITTRTAIKVNDPVEFENILNHKTQSSITNLLRDALIDEKYNVYTYASININIFKERISREELTYYSVEDTAIPNPHIMGFSCFGQYTQIITNLIFQNKFMEAVEEAIEAASGLNWADSPVINKLFEYIDEYDETKFIEDSNGNLLTLKEYERRKSEAISNQTEETATVNITVGQTQNGPVDTTVIR